ncbi:MAG: hypothetical protein RLZZ157_580, partial [Pseudomonadota bacterium]
QSLQSETIGSAQHELRIFSATGAQLVLRAPN